MEKLRVFEAFAGVGSQRMALRNLNIDHKVVGICEIDVDAIITYAAICGVDLNKDVKMLDKVIDKIEKMRVGFDFKLGKSKIPRMSKVKKKQLANANEAINNFGDISLINPNDLPDMDLFTYSFPCQDLSVAGKQAGLGEGTRSGLLYECEKVIESKKPKYLLLENVKNLVGKKFKGDFDKWLEYLEGLGYTNYWKVLNAKDYGIPQNRERIFVVSILDDNQGFEFKEKIELNKRIKDILENEVEGKYYINREWHFTREYEQKHDENEIAQLDGINYKATRSIGDIDKICRCLDTMGGGQREPKVLIHKGNTIELPCIAASRGRNPENTSDRTVGAPTEQMLEINTKGTSSTVTTVQKDNYTIEENYRVRKLTPLECWRLMGFKDEDFYKAKNAGISNSQLYKQAGNSIVVNVLEGIFENLFKEYTNEENN
ncbi:MAG: DNA (cytosine-5-)-methyltransferase [Clostridium butyricum]